MLTFCPAWVVDQLKPRLTDLTETERIVNAPGIEILTQPMASPPPLPVDRFVIDTLTTEAVPAVTTALSAMTPQA